MVTVAMFPVVLPFKGFNFIPFYIYDFFSRRIHINSIPSVFHSFQLLTSILPPTSFVCLKIVR